MSWESDPVRTTPTDAEHGARPVSYRTMHDIVAPSSRLTRRTALPELSEDAYSTQDASLYRYWRESNAFGSVDTGYLMPRPEVYDQSTQLSRPARPLRRRTSRVRTSAVGNDGIPESSGSVSRGDRSESHALRPASRMAPPSRGRRGDGSGASDDPTDPIRSAGSKQRRKRRRKRKGDDAGWTATLGRLADPRTMPSRLPDEAESPHMSARSAPAIPWRPTSQFGALPAIYSAASKMTSPEAPAAATKPVFRQATVDRLSQPAKAAIPPPAAAPRKARPRPPMAQPTATVPHSPRPPEAPRDRTAPARNSAAKAAGTGAIVSPASPSRRSTQPGLLPRLSSIKNIEPSAHVLTETTSFRRYQELQRNRTGSGSIPGYSSVPELTTFFGSSSPGPVYAPRPPPSPNTSPHFCRPLKPLDRGSFLSSGPGSMGRDSPGPNYYSPSSPRGTSPLSHSPSAVIPRESQFKSNHTERANREKWPGPGQYAIPSAVKADAKYGSSFGTAPRRGTWSATAVVPHFG